MKCRPSIAVAAVALLLGAATVAAAGQRACVREAKKDAKDCAASCKETLQTAKDACLNRDHACVEVCRANRSQCRLDSGLDALIDACNDALEARRAECRANNPPGDDRDLCIDRAQVDAFECRDAARELARPLLKQCRKAFRACAKACPAPDPADPALDPKQCIRDANAAAKVCGAACREELQVAKDDCRNRDHDCMEACRADRTACRAPVRAEFDAALAVCAADRASGIDGCVAQFPPPRDPAAQLAFDQCVDGVQVAAFVCRDAAHEAARPGILACRQAFRACVDTNCPVQAE
ncbi:MAG: hypothetical protein IT293_17135 [Deltaproteobacteria bacterium]|nr:hypothetical protein [Deltaproteobacteria bacterium]